MKLNTRVISGNYLVVVAAIEVLYSAISLLCVAVVKIYSFPMLQKEIMGIKVKLKESQFHLKGLGVLPVDVDVEAVERVIYASLWGIFIGGLIWLAANVGMALYLLFGVRRADDRRMKGWVIFGVGVLLLDISCYPLKLAVCNLEKNILGPICRPPLDDHIWLIICLKLLFYSSLPVAFIHRRALQAEMDPTDPRNPIHKKNKKKKKKNEVENDPMADTSVQKSQFLCNNNGGEPLDKSSSNNHSTIHLVDTNFLESPI